MRPCTAAALADVGRPDLALRVVDPAEDPRIRPGQCHDTTTIAGAEFICIADPHPDREAGKWTLAEALERGRRPLSTRHFFIKRYVGPGAT